MTTSRSKIEVSGIAVEVVRKEIKNLHVGVYPPSGRVRVAAPVRMGEEAVRLAVVSRLGWIRRRQAEFGQQARQSQRELVTGESHYFQGRRYLLNVIEHEDAPSVRLANRSRIEMRVRVRADRNVRAAALEQWYREQLKGQLPPLIAKWERKVGVTVAEARIRKMKTCWGSCNAAARRIWLNLELVKKPIVCLEYILVHEMVHIVERHHNERFHELVDTLMPSWRIYREELNRAPLAHERWRY